MGYREYEAIAARYRVPIVVTGFEPVDILQGIYHCIQQLETGQAWVENQYSRSVRKAGNETAQALLNKVFEIIPQTWRGIGEIPASGLGLKPEFAAYDVYHKGLLSNETVPTIVTECMSGLVLQGILKPQDCPAFGNRCTPEQPLGAPMVSSEGACAAYYRYRLLGWEEDPTGPCLRIKLVEE
jgi:hydrogenase expression/formation protein HypD